MTAHTWERALVTGASSGIGDAIARQLASAGTDLVVVARDAARLEALAKEMIERERVDVEVLPADLADPAQVAVVEERLATSRLPIDLLVNNAGFGTGGEFVTLPIEDEVREIEVNVVALVRLTHAALPRLIEGRRGAVMNVSSMASLQPSPRNATYGATKAFVTSFTEAVHEELRGTGVTITAVLPGFTRTEFQERAGLTDTAGLPGFVWQTASACAAAAIAGTAKGQAIVVPGGKNKVVVGLTHPIPRGIKRRIVGLLSKRF